MVPAERLAQMQINKEPPEASEVVSLDNLTGKILHRKDISDWEKASMLASTLERFLALRPRALDEPNLPVPAALVHSPKPPPLPAKETTPEPVTVVKAKRKPRRPVSPDPTKFEKERRSSTREHRVPKRLQEGNGLLKNWIFL